MLLLYYNIIYIPIYIYIYKYLKYIYNKKSKHDSNKNKQSLNITSSILFNFINITISNNILWCNRIDYVLDDNIKLEMVIYYMYYNIYTIINKW